MQAISVRDSQPGRRSAPRRDRRGRCGLGFSEEEAGRARNRGDRAGHEPREARRRRRTRSSAPSSDGSGDGVECLALDKGPGMADVHACLRDGYSTAGTPGTGLGAIARLSRRIRHLFAAGPRHGAVSRGRAARAAGTRAVAGPPLRRRVSCRSRARRSAATPGARRPVADGLTLMVADGLGHGPLAAEAASGGAWCFRAAPRRRRAEILGPHPRGPARRRAARRSRSRGSTSAAACVRFAGVGNIAGTLIAGRRRSARWCRTTAPLGTP